ncbi:hypothetical protein AOB54_00945 [beta proteobacterium MWH-UniP1]
MKDAYMTKKLTFGQWLGLRSAEYVVILALLGLFGGEGTFEETLKAGVVVFVAVRILVLLKVLK